MTRNFVCCRCVKPGVKTFVLDCEVVAYDREKNKILPFQVILHPLNLLHLNSCNLIFTCKYYVTSLHPSC